MAESADVVMAGGGIMGSAIAYFLTADPAFDGSVVVVEPDPTYAQAATTLSWGGIRQQFSMAENIQMGTSMLILQTVIRSSMFMASSVLPAYS